MIENEDSEDETESKNESEDQNENTEDNSEEQNEDQNDEYTEKTDSETDSEDDDKINDPLVIRKEGFVVRRYEKSNKHVLRVFSYINKENDIYFIINKYQDPYDILWDVARRLVYRHSNTYKIDILTTENRKTINITGVNWILNVIPRSMILYTLTLHDCYSFE